MSKKEKNKESQQNLSSKNPIIFKGYLIKEKDNINLEKKEK